MLRLFYAFQIFFPHSRIWFILYNLLIPAKIEYLEIKRWKDLLAEYYKIS